MAVSRPTVAANANLRSLFQRPSTPRPIWDPDSGLSEKVRRACEVARRDGYRYIWIDSCCINKESSAELSEAINSMYNWYRGAQVCYAFLADVPPGGDVRAKDSKFRESRWFKRGWTLQELVAPLVVVFLSKDWQYLGTKDGLADLIKDITSIDIGILTHERVLSEESVANRMRWAARRETTRVEDQAYSLLGIFGITMPTLYGEGQNAFRRLQEQILERIPDHSIFVWGYRDAQPFPLTQHGLHSSHNVRCADRETLLALSPAQFYDKNWGKSPEQRIIRPAEDSIKSLELPVEEFTRTPYGIRTKVCLLPLEALNPHIEILVKENKTVSWYLIVLCSQYAHDPLRLLCRLCYIRTDNAPVKLLYLERGFLMTQSTFGGVFILSIDDISHIRNTLQLKAKTVYLPHLKPPGAERQIEKVSGVKTLSLSLPTWALAVLQAGGYTVTNIQTPTQTKYGSYSYLSFAFTLINATFGMHIHYRCVEHWLKPVVAIAARVWILSPGEEVVKTNTDIQLSLPYTAAAWVDCHPWNMTLPTRSLNLIMDSGESVTLRLGLDLVEPRQYNLRVDVGPYINTEVGAPFRPHLEKLPSYRAIFPGAHTTLNLVLMGSARRALETKGYSAHLVVDPSLCGSYGSHSLTLTPTNTAGPDKFAIIVKYLHAAQGVGFPGLGGGFDPDRKFCQFAIVARVTLECINPGFKTAEDGPYFLFWKCSPDYWSAELEWSLEQKCVVLTTPTGTLFTLQLGLVLAWYSEYYLDIDIDPGTSSLGAQELSSTRKNPRIDGDHDMLNNWAHDGISLTLRGDDRRALQAQGYQVHFKTLDDSEGDESDGRVYHRLTLSHIDVTVIVEYSHRLITHYPEPGYSGSKLQLQEDYPFFLADPQMHSHSDSSTSTAKVPLKRCNQELTFQASVRTEPPCSVQEVTPSRDAVQGNDTIATVDWKARADNPKYRAGQWSRSFEPGQITITCPTGHQLMLLLNLHLGWFSEYCLMVEINPLPPCRAHPLVDAELVPEYGLDELDELDETSVDLENIRQPLTQSAEPGQSAEVHDEPLLADPRRRINPEGSPVGSKEGAGGGGGNNPDLHSGGELLPLHAGPSGSQARVRSGESERAMTPMPR
ncbi:hypothetical protein GSI_13225 [Ganoderma sinense ZZ0214-1]|uniref:Uncharacterized protein n=1 Tax=Ganoderma sinense ZZ0214-1 TaxID=1077348 RepID=A0A2G8RUY9_9APHY|nr:hypothetical protein GSI_13225 [Ganoderma sinense ZZ0214-1]